MAEIVAAVAASHTPLLFLRHDDPAPEIRERVFAAYERMGKLVADSGAEALIVFGNDHFHSLFMDRHPPLAVGVAPKFPNVPSEGYMPEVGSGRAGDEKLGLHLVKELLAGHFDAAMCQEVGIDHSFVCPIHFMGDLPIPIVPIYQNSVSPPLAPARRAYEIGVAVRRALEKYDGLDRVAVLGTGGPSHWIGTPGMGRIDEEWDGRVIDLLCAGNAGSLSEWSNEGILEGGNGGNEIRNWISAAAAAGDTPADLLIYEAEPMWFLGVTVLSWPVGPTL